MAANAIHDFFCTACGCACDDLTLNVDENRIMALEPQRPLAERFLLAGRTHKGAGNVAPAIEQAARLLREARAPRRHDIPLRRGRIAVAKRA
jgi:formylmethanofuran dehydrogenase subunit B